MDRVQAGFHERWGRSRYRLVPARDFDPTNIGEIATITGSEPGEERGGRVSRLSRPFGIGAIAAIMAAACSGNFDTTRVERPYEKEATLGQEVYGVLCDRLGATVLAEDLEGHSYHAICHPDAEGNYQDTVDTFRLPAVGGAAAVPRNLAVAKLEKLASRRDDLIRAFDVIAPDVEIDDPYAEAGEPKKVRLHDALAELLERLNPLYDSNPLASQGGIPEPLLPASTQALARVFAAMSQNEDAQRALAYIGGRKGYRPASSALGVIQPILSYPNLRSLSQQSVRMLSPGGPARDEFLHLLNVVHEEMRSSRPKLPLGNLIIDDTLGIAQPNRARDNLEVLQNVLLATDPKFGNSSLQSGLVVLRDYRGFALVSGNEPGIVGSVPAPFADTDSDGVADVDAFGRFIGTQGEPVAVDHPFLVPGEPRVRPADSQGRAVLENGDPAYQYIDTTKTLVSSLLRDLESLVDPDLANERETLMYALAGAYVLFGDRTEKTYTYEGDDGAERNIEYRGFDPDTSPIVDLVHAMGQILADPQSDDYLKQLIDLMENHEQEMARVIGVALQLKEIADGYPDVALPGDSNFWDHFAQVFAKVSAVGFEPTDPEDEPGENCTDAADNDGDTWIDCGDEECFGQPHCPGLLEDMIVALTNEDTLELSEVYSKFMTYRDVMNYDRNNINGRAWNYTTQNNNYPTTPVDRTKPAVGDNMSMFQRSMQIVFDSTRTTACNKDGAKVYLEAEALGMIGLSLVYPDDGIFNLLCLTTKKDHLGWCDVFRIEDMTEFYLQSLIEDDPKLAPGGNKNKARLVVRDACLSGLDWATDMDDAFEKSSGITGLTTKPTHTALNRLVFFGADSDALSMPDLDPFRNDEGLLNWQVNRFVSNLQEPMGTPLCPKNSAGVNVCATADDAIRVRNPGTLFLWEEFDFAKANRPVLGAFYKYDREDLFGELIDVVHFHMPADDHGTTCSKTGSWDRDSPSFNPRYCAESGLVRYEPMMAEQLQTDLLPALHELINIVHAQRIQSTRYLASQGASNVERRGTEVMASMTRLLFDPAVASRNGIAYRDGSTGTVWSDGVTYKKQTTPYDMMAEALKKIDARFETADGFDAADRDARRAEWRKARSQLVDQFLAIDGEGSNARFRNPAIPKAIVMTLKTLREQLNANCPDREKGVECTWAKEEMSRKVAEVIADPLFAAVVDLVDKLRADPSRVELERLAQYLLEVVEDDETMRKVLASAVDLILVLRDGQTLPPVFNVLAALSTPEDDASVPGSADITLQLLNVLSRDADDTVGPDDPLVFDRYRALDHVLANLVKPIDDTQPSQTALEVLIDVAADIHRYDSEDADPLTDQDFRVISDSVHKFLTDETRGMEQLYEVVRGANGE